MAKTKVFELAQKLGLDNKAMLERLQKAGIDAKSQNAVLEEADIKKFEAASAPGKPAGEERINAGTIRRRRKETSGDEGVAVEVEAAVVQSAPAVEPASLPVAPPVAAPVVTPPPAAPAEAVAVVETPAARSVASAEKGPASPRVEPTAGVAPVVASEKVTPPSAVVQTPAADGAGEAIKTEPAKTGGGMREVKLDKPTPGRARILGRVELPAPGVPQRRDDSSRPQQRREGSAPPPRDGGAPRPGGPPQRDGGERRPSAPGGPGGSRPSGPGGPGGPRPATGDRPPRPAGAPGGFNRPARPLGGPPAAAPPADLFGGKEQRGKKKAKGKGKPGEFSSPDADGARNKNRREIFEPERSEKLRRGKKAPKPQKKTEITVSKAIKRVIRISDSITVGELAKRMGVKATDLIKELMRQGTMVTINHPLDYESAAILAADFQYEVENVAFDEESLLEHAIVKGEEETQENLQPRPPVVTIMGHVDHGKTSLLDAIRAANVTAGEAGGITQHIGAYDVELDGRKITFLDTPGHEAFTAMRARGAKVTDIVILVVAADDGVMPQTKEAINHAKAAGVPIVVAINKIDKADANPDKVKQELTEFGLVCEEWGGDTIFCEVSAKKRINLEQLLEMILLQAEVLDLKANPDKRARGTIVEARLDRGRGPVATVLVQEGTLKIGDPIVSGNFFGRVRTMTDDRGKRVEAAGPSFPVEVTGLSGVPAAGDTFHAVEDEKTAKDIAQHREQKMREVELAKSSKISLEQLYARIQQGDVKELKVIVKGDVQGSVEAVKDSLLKLSTAACRLVVLHAAVGGIIESDVTLASASDAIVLGFNIRPETKAAALAEAEGVDIRLYNIIYDAVADIRSAMEGLLAPTLREKAMGRVEVRNVFTITKIGTIAGCYVLDGKVARNAQVRLVRDNVVVWTGKLSSLKRFKDDAREVATGYECGVGLENYNDIKVGDIIEAFEMEEVKTTL